MLVVGKMNGVEQTLREKFREFLTQSLFKISMESHVVTHVCKEGLTWLEVLDDNHCLSYTVMRWVFGPTQSIDYQRVDAIEFWQVSLVNLRTIGDVA